MEDSTGLASADGQVPEWQCQVPESAVDHCRVLPCIAVIPGKATQLGEPRTYSSKERKELTKG